MMEKYEYIVHQIMCVILKDKPRYTVLCTVDTDDANSLLIEIATRQDTLVSILNITADCSLQSTATSTKNGRCSDRGWHDLADCSADVLVRCRKRSASEPVSASASWPNSTRA